MSSKSLVRRGLLPLALTAIALAALTPAAQAWTLHEHHYEKFLQPGQYELPYGQSFSPWEVTGNIAVYEGSGSVGVCQRTEDLTTFTVHEGCGTNAVGNALNLTPYYGHSLYPGMKNNSSFAHTIDDYFYTGTP